MTITEKDLPKISAANTKKEMMEAFRTIREKIKEQARAELKPARAKAQKKEKEVVEIADRVATDDVNTRVNTLKLEVGNALSDIARKLEEENVRYHKVKEAIEVKQKELDDIFEIDKAAHALAALLEAQKQKKAEFEENMDWEKEQLEEEISETRADWEKEKKAYLEKIQEQKKGDEVLRKRRKEEFDYNFNREKELKQQALEDELARLEKELAGKKENFEKEVADKEHELHQRETDVSAREQSMDELQSRVDTFPGELENRVNQAIKNTTATLKAEAQKSEALLAKGYEGEINVLSAKIESLQGQVADQNKQIETLTAQINAAYGKVQDIAVKAVASTQMRPPAQVPAAPVSVEPEKG